MTDGDLQENVEVWCQRAPPSNAIASKYIISVLGVAAIHRNNWVVPLQFFCNIETCSEKTPIE